MKKLLLILLCLPFIGFGQGWEKTFGQPSQMELGSSVHQTTDGGYIIAGHIGDVPVSSSYLIKTDNNGLLDWSQVYGGGIYSEVARCVRQINNGDYIIRGLKFDTISGGITSYLRKIDPNGIVQWNIDDYLHAIVGDNSVQQTNDGGYIIVGLELDTVNWTGVIPQLIKLDGNGTELWKQPLVSMLTFANWVNSYPHYIQQTMDGGYIISGTNSNLGLGLLDMIILKTDINGIEQWSISLTDSSSNYFNSSIKQTSDSGYIVLGSKIDSVSQDPPNGILIKINSSGIVQWQKNLGFTIGNSVQQANDGGYIIGGAKIDSVSEKGILIKTDNNGVEQWNKSFGNGLLEISSFNSVQQIFDGGYIALGSKVVNFNTSILDFDMYLVKTDSLGNITSTFNIPINSNRKLQKTVDLLGRESKPQKNIPFIEIYDDGTVEKKITID